MAISLLSNSSADGVLRRLDATTRGRSRNFERLSSGLRIVHASDDSAGLAVASDLNAEAVTRIVASRNINDGLSALTIMDEALAQQGDIVTRLSELAEQSANGTITHPQRSALQLEYRQLVAEYNRIGDTTEFNGLSLLLGNRADGASSVGIQAGVDGSSNSLINLDGVDTGTYSGQIDLDELPVMADLFGNFFTPADLIEASPYILEQTLTDSSGNPRTIYAAMFKRSATSYSLYFVARNQGDEGKPLDEGVANDFDVSDNITSAMIDFTVNSVTGAPSRFSPSINLTLQDTDTPAATVHFSASFEGLRFFSSSGARGPRLDGEANNLDFTLIANQSSARRALDITKNAQNRISKLRGDVGAVQSRLLSAGSVNEVTQSNVEAARSSIQDADVAEEASIATALRIRESISVSVLAQANQIPQLALLLLQ